MSSAACPSSALLAAVARDELAPRRLSPSAASSSAGVPFANSDGATGGGPLGTLRRSLRQMNPFRSRLFRLPATPRLSRSKKVLARGEDFTGWNFERPSKASADSLRPFGTSFSSADVPPFAAPQTRPQRRRLSQMPSPALHSHCHQMAGPGEQCGCCASGNEMDELDVFLSTMESIVRRGAPVGGSCRMMRHSDEQFEREELPNESRGTVAGNGGAFARATEAGTRRFRPPIPSFNPPSPFHPSAYDSKRCPEAMAQGKHRIQLGNHREDEYQFLPSTCYAPDGKMFAASLFFLFGGTPQSLLVRCRTSLATIRHDDNSLAGDSHLFAPSAAQLANSPGQASAISLLNTASAVTLAVRGTRSASAVSSGQQKKCVRSSSLFPKTQLQRRRSACSALSAGVGIAEETEENDGRTAGERANYYGREVIRLMEEEEEAQETHNKATDAFLCRPSVSDRLAPCSLANHSSSSSPSLLPAPPPLFPPPDEIFTEVIEFVGREWLFRDLCHQLITEHAQLILVHGASGSGKSALIRHIAAHSANFGDAYAQSASADAQQHNTVDSGIAIGNGFSSTGSGGANSSGSQLSLLNLPVHLSADASASANVTALSSVQIHNEWLHILAKNVVAVHFARLHNSLSCSISEFARSICAQMCSSVQLKFTYGRMIRSDPRLHQLATHEGLDIEPFELFLELVCRPLAKLIKEEECQRRQNAAAKGRRSSSRSSDYGSNGGAYAANGANESRRPFASDAPILLVLVDSLDEAAFHRSDGGESIGWLLRRILSADGACLPQLRFVCTLLSPEGLPCQPPLLSQMLGPLDDKMAFKWPEAVRSIRLDDWEGDERIARDLRQFVEQRVNGSPALAKWIHAQFRRQSFFTSPGPTANVPSVAEFGVQLMAHHASKWPGGAEEPLLCSFARSGNLEMVQLLLQFGANPNAGDPPPLIVAIENGHEEVIRVLCAHPGTDLFIRSTNGHGVLYHAAARDSIETVALLVDALGDADGKLGRKTAGMASRCIENERREASSHQRYSACSSSYEDEFQSHRLRQRMGDEQSTGKAADNRRDYANDRSQFIREAFEAAAARGSARVCRFLLDNTDAVVDMARGMCIACANGHSEVVQFLLSRGITLSSEQKWDGKSALICAVESGSWDLVVNVLNSSSDGAEGTMDQLNRVVGPDGLSPLMVAARHGHVGLVDLLINRGAQLDLSDSHGRTAAMHGIEAGHSSTVALLLERGSALFARDSHGNTMLHLLGRHPNKCLIYRLLEDGLSLEDKNKEDLRPIEVAIRAGQLIAVDTFLRRGARLRSLTWQIALSSHPPLVLVLLRKLLDDAQILLRRKRTAEAQHRLSYALQKCDELLEKAEAEDNEALRRMGPQLRRVKVQAFHSMATLKRRCNDLSDAIALASNALELLDHHNVGGGVPAGNSLRPPSRGSLGGEREEKTDAERRAEDEQRFELHLLRAKCHFDARDLERARVDAQLATCMKPEEAEAQNLLAVLSAGN
ncbi:hypothetical protein niasHT_030113 [Heterodera trifolii]|uniref:Uncharacterized protein n=1 Tax=Heterodera trifolii TaxID=157864 RepID=A0ABD2JGD3_9BILA